MLTDRDILAAEPYFFSENCFESQVLTGGTNGIVAGTQFTASGVDFTSAQVAAGHVMTLKSVDGSIDGGFEVVALIDSSHLTLSILRSDPAGAPIPVGSASGLTWEIKTYTPQIAAAETELSYRLLCTPGYPASGIALDEIDNPAAVKRTWLYQLLSDLYGALYGAYPPASDANAPASWASHKAKRIWYRGMSERMLSLLR